MNKRRFAFRAAAVLILVGIAAWMMVIGRGHTVYIDNKTLEYEGQTYKAFHRAVVYVNGEKISKLAARERCSATNIGQTFTMTVGIVEEKGQDEKPVDITVKLPYNWDGVIVNIPGYMAGLPQEAWMTEFVSTPSEAEMQEEAPGEEEDILAGAEF